MITKSNSSSNAMLASQAEISPSKIKTSVTFGIFGSLCIPFNADGASCTVLLILQMNETLYLCLDLGKHLEFHMKCSSTNNLAICLFDM